MNVLSAVRWFGIPTRQTGLRYRSWLPRFGNEAARGGRRPPIMQIPSTGETDEHRPGDHDERRGERSSSASPEVRREKRHEEGCTQGTFVTIGDDRGATY